MNMNEKLWKEFLKTPQTKKEKETLGEAVVAIVEETKERLHEGQKGTAFEDVVVAVAKGKNPGKKGNLKMGDHGGKWKGMLFKNLAIEALAKMGLKPGGDKGAEKYSPPDGKDEEKFKGDPKTDIILDEKRISLKLPGPIQFASGEGPSSEDAIKRSLEEFLVSLSKQNLDAQGQKQIREALEASVEDFFVVLRQTYGKRYLPVDPDTNSYWDMIIDKVMKNWRGDKKNPKGKWPSGSEVPADVKRKGPPQEVFPDLNDWVSYYLDRAINNAYTNDKNADISYNKFKEEVTVVLQEKLADLMLQQDGFYKILIDEWLTGRRQFNKTPSAVAEYLLSPDGYYPIKTEQDTEALAKKWKDYIKTDIRAKGRPFLSKSITVRIDFDANKYYKSLASALEDTAEEAASKANILPEDSTTTSPVEEITSEMFKDLVGDISIEIDPDNIS